MKLVLKDLPSLKDVVRRVSSRAQPDEAPHVESDLRELAGGRPPKAFVESLLELQEDDLASVLFRTWKRLLEASAPAPVLRRQLRVLWLAWCARFDDDAELLAYLRDRIPPDACVIEQPTDFLVRELRELLAPPG